jgi:hypothetical protein
MVCLFGALFSLVASGTLVVCKNNTRVLGTRNINQKRSRKTSEFCFIFVRTHDIIVWYHNKHTMIALFHIDRLHVTWSAISATTTLCCHCQALTRCHIQARVSASVRAQDAASEGTRGHDAMSERTRTHAKSAREDTAKSERPGTQWASVPAHNATTNVMWCMIPHNNPPQHLN